MSTNSECLILQVRKDQWFYVLEDRDAPKNAWDWREYARGYGPFPTEEAAQEHLRNCHPNPGGSCTAPLPPGVDELDLAADSVLKRLIEEAPNNTRRAPVRRRW